MNNFSESKKANQQNSQNSTQAEAPSAAASPAKAASFRKDFIIIRPLSRLRDKFIREKNTIDPIQIPIALFSAVLSSVALAVFFHIRHDNAALSQLYASSCFEHMVSFLDPGTLCLGFAVALFYLFSGFIIKKRHLSCCIVSLLLGANMVISLSMEHSELSEIFLPFGVTGNLVVFLGFVLLIAVFIEFFYLLMDRLTVCRSASSTEKSTSSTRVFMLSLYAIWLFWLPWLIALYPGCSFYDTYYQIHEWLGLSGIDASFPVLITAIYGILYQIGVATQDSTRGLFLCVIFQMLLNSFVIAYVSAGISKLLKKKAFSIGFVLFFAVLPTWQHAAVYVVKDVLHVGVFLLFYFHYLEFLIPDK